MTRGSEPSKKAEEEHQIERDVPPERVPGSYVLIDKIRNLYRSGNFKATIDEIKHYLGTFTYRVKSPLIIQLLDLFKLVIVKDIERLDEHLDILDILFNLNSTIDIRTEIMDIFAKLSSVQEIKEALFHRYLPVVKERLPSLDLATKAFIIEILVSLSNGIKALQEEIIKFLLERITSAPNDEMVEIFAAWRRILRNEPELEILFEEKITGLLETYSSHDGEDVDSAFAELVPHLQTYHVVMMSMCQKWLGAGYTKLHYKATKLVPHLHPVSGEREILKEFLTQLDTEDLEYQSNVVEATVELIAKNFPYYLSHAAAFFSSKPLSKNERMGVVELFTVLASKDFNAIFTIIFDDWQGTSDGKDKLYLSILKNLEYEYPVRFETAFMGLLAEFEHYHEGTKLVLLEKVSTIAMEFNVQTLIIWIARFLKQITFQSHKYDEEIAKQAITIYQEIKEKIPNLENDLAHVQADIDEIEQKIQMMKDYPRRLREQVDALITSGDFRQGTKFLKNEYNRILQTIFKFDTFINSLNFKHLIIENVNEWYQAKEYIVDDLNLVREYLDDAIKKCLRAEESSNLQDAKYLESKARVLDVMITDAVSEIDRQENADHATKTALLEKIQGFKTNLLTLDNDFYKFYFTNGHDDTGANGILDKWEETKQRLHVIVQDGESRINRGEVPSGVVTRNLELYERQVKQAIHEYKKLLQDVEKDNQMFDSSIKLQDVQGMERKITYIQNKYLDFIEQRASMVEKHWKSLKEQDAEVDQLITMRRLHDDMEVTKENLIVKIQDIFKNKLEMIDVERIKQMLNVSSPIPMEALQPHLKSISTKDSKRFADELLMLINKHNIDMTISEDNIYNNEAFLQNRNFEDFIRIKATLVDKENKIVLKGVVENNSIQDLYDVSIAIRLPSELRLLEREEKKMRTFESVLEVNKAINVTWELERPARDEKRRNVEKTPSPRIIIVVNGRTSSQQNITKSEALYILY
nr:hypothetical protein [Candidatus Sigynarchaeota archaeon]